SAAGCCATRTRSAPRGSSSDSSSSSASSARASTRRRGCASARPPAQASTTERGAPGALATVRIHYLRPPDRARVYVQRLVHRAPDVVVTYVERTPLARTMVVDGEVALEPGAPAVWFTFPGAWHDIGRFHRLDGTFTGFYANVITPVEFVADDAWRTT